MFRIQVYWKIFLFDYVLLSTLELTIIGEFNIDIMSKFHELMLINELLKNFWTSGMLCTHSCRIIN